MPLTDLQIRKVKQKGKPFRLGDGLGLHLLVKPNGSKLWQFRYRYRGKEKLLSLGQYPIVSLADARKKRDDAKRQLEDGTDPSVQKKLDRINAEVKARMTSRRLRTPIIRAWLNAALLLLRFERSVGKLRI